MIDHTFKAVRHCNVHVEPSGGQAYNKHSGALVESFQVNIPGWYGGEGGGEGGRLGNPSPSHPPCMHPGLEYSKQRAHKMAAKEEATSFSYLGLLRAVPKLDQHSIT